MGPANRGPLLLWRQAEHSRTDQIGLCYRVVQQSRIFIFFLTVIPPVDEVSRPVLLWTSFGIPIDIRQR